MLDLSQRGEIMKKVIKAICSALCVTSMAMPAAALADPPGEPEDRAEDVPVQQLSDDHHLAFVTGDFGLQTMVAVRQQPLGDMLLFISDRQGKIVKDARVVTTVIDPAGGQLMQRALPMKGGYLIDTMHLPPGRYRLETEVVTQGQLLTDLLVFQKV
jgi:hypothetical protein